MKCSFCGHELEPGSNFCPECGTMMSFDDEAPQEKKNVSAEQKYEPDSADTYVSAAEEDSLAEQPGEETLVAPEYVPKAPSAFEDYNTIRSNEEAAEAQNDSEEDDPFAELHPDEGSELPPAPAGFEPQEKEESADDDDDDMYVKPAKSKKGTAAIAVLAIVLVAVIVIGVNAVRGGSGDILSVFKKIETSEDANGSTAEPTTESTAPSIAEKTTKPADKASTEKTTAEDESKTTETSESVVTTTKAAEEKTTTEKASVPTTTKAYTTTTTKAYTTTKEYTTTKAYTTTKEYTTTNTTTAPATTTPSLKKPDKYYSAALTRYASVNGVSMRLRPSSSSAVRASISVGGEVKVYGEENGFCYVYYPRYGVYGWVSAKYLSKERPVAESEVKVSGVVAPDKTYSNPKTKTVTTSEGLRLRKGPGTAYDTIRYLGEGYPVLVKGESSKNPGWVYVTDITRGVSGWVAAAYIK